MGKVMLFSPIPGIAPDGHNQYTTVDFIAMKPVGPKENMPTNLKKTRLYFRYMKHMSLLLTHTLR